MAQVKTLPIKPTVLGFVTNTRAAYEDSSRLKKLIILSVAAVFIIGLAFFVGAKRTSKVVPVQSQIIKLEKSFDFPALNNLGKPSGTKVKFKITQAERTDRVNVKDQTVFAKNNKLFLVLNLDLKNDATLPVNIVPGDLVRLAYSSDKDNLYASDLHNNAVQIAPISTRNDRLGFVISDDVKEFTLLIGELEKKKEEVTLKFGSWQANL